MRARACNEFLNDSADSKITSALGVGLLIDTVAFIGLAVAD